MLLGFIIFMAIFAIIGLWSARHSKGSTEDYLLASRQVPAWLTGLSAAASNNSGQMFIGLIGYTYAQGFSAIWLAMGWLLGDYIAARMVYKKIRILAGRRRVMSFSGLLSQWQGRDYRVVRLLAGIITVLFLTAYAAAQLKAGSKALHVLLGWDYSAGTILGAIIVLAYCFAGGIRASIWTDAAQSIVMIVAMGLLFFLAVDGAGGMAAFAGKLALVRPDYLAWFPQNELLGPLAGPALFVLGWLLGGFGVSGQPHIVVRFIAIDNAAAVARARFYYYTWSIGFYALTIGAGLATRLYVSGAAPFDMELALPLMATELLPGIGVGIVLAGLFAATMSTADSQILSCTASVTQDMTQRFGHSLLFTKLVTMTVAAIALAIALSGNQSVFSLVLMAWASLASAFTPLLLVQTFGGKPSQSTAVVMMLAGLAASIAWKQSGMGDMIYEIVPGLLAGFAVYFFGTLIRKAAAPVRVSSRNG